MSRVQLALNVSDLDSAVAFYSKLFATEPAKLRPGYANFAIADPPLKLVLFEGAGEPGSLNHLGVEVASTDDVQAAQRAAHCVRPRHQHRRRSHLLLRGAGQGLGGRTRRPPVGDLHRFGRRPRHGPVLLLRRATAEAVGTGLLVAIVVGSGIAAQRYSPDDAGLQLLANSIATGAGLVALILALGPISGAHFNPIVTLVDRAHGGTSTRDASTYIAAQVLGACAGTMVANLMFDLPAVTLSTHTRSSAALWLGEIVATFGLLLTILAVVRSGRIERGALRGRRLHRGRVLVHVFHQLRESRPHHRTLTHQHLRRHQAEQRPHVRHRATRRRRARRRPVRTLVSTG